MAVAAGGRSLDRRRALGIGRQPSYHGCSSERAACSRQAVRSSRYCSTLGNAGIPAMYHARDNY